MFVRSIPKLCFRTSKITIEGFGLHIVESGPEDGVPIICMPGAMGTAKTDFPYQLEGLAECGYRVISFDPRGYGESRPPMRRFPSNFYDIDADDAVRISESLQLDSFNLLGWSDGANASVKLAAKYPQKVERLVIFGGNSYVTKHDIAAYEATRDVERTWSAGMKGKLIPIYGADLQPMWDSFCDAMKAIHDAGGDICKEEAKRIKCETLILHGNKDPIVPTEHAEWFKENIPNSSDYYFPDGKHNIHIKYGEQVNGIVDLFFQGSAKAI